MPIRVIPPLHEPKGSPYMYSGKAEIEKKIKYERLELARFQAYAARQKAERGRVDENILNVIEFKKKRIAELQAELKKY